MLDRELISIAGASILAGFGLSDYTLFKWVCELSDAGIAFMMSNANVELVQNAFVGVNNIVMEVVECRRRINSKKPESVAEELIIMNYKVA